MLDNVTKVSHLTFIDEFIVSTFTIIANGVGIALNYTADKQERTARLDRTWG